ncbi:hypothetical protein ACFLZ7_01805 [Nanoarchaeota archaeon]
MNKKLITILILCMFFVNLAGFANAQTVKTDDQIADDEYSKYTNPFDIIKEKGWDTDFMSKWALYQFKIGISKKLKSDPRLAWAGTAWDAAGWIVGKVMWFLNIVPELIGNNIYSLSVATLILSASLSVFIRGWMAWLLCFIYYWQFYYGTIPVEAQTLTAPVFLGLFAGIIVASFIITKLFGKMLRGWLVKLGGLIFGKLIGGLIFKKLVGRLLWGKVGRPIAKLTLGTLWWVAFDSRWLYDKLGLQKGVDFVARISGYQRWKEHGELEEKDKKARIELAQKAMGKYEKEFVGMLFQWLHAAPNKGVDEEEYEKVYNNIINVLVKEKSLSAEQAEAILKGIELLGRSRKKLKPKK